MKNLQPLMLLAIAATIGANPSTSLSNPNCTNVEFWCENLLNAKECNAVNFCITSVWETHNAPKESGIICDDCKEWVGKARSFIEKKDKSGEVIKSLKWTCDLIPVNALRTSCEDIVVENIPEILKMLESTMNPDVICSKLFFCNNAQHDKALIDHSKATEVLLPFTCSQCHHISSIIETKFHESDRDDVLKKLLGVCGELSSFSDSCTSLVMMYFDDIYQTMSKNVRSENLCQMSDACIDHPYQREGIVDIIPPGMSPGDDLDDPNIPCELCQQLVLHLRELLVLNTTEIEFRNVMIGFCHQMGGFSNECIDIIHQYSDFIYDFLVDKLNANKACVLISICPKQEGFNDRGFSMPTMPLVSTDIHPAPQPNSGADLIDVQMTSVDSSLTLYKNGTLCTTCDYFIHFIQEALRKQWTEDKVITEMKRECGILPAKFEGDCVALIELYGDTLISLVDQNMDPRLICPKIKLCPPNLSLDVINMTTVNDKPTCPFCLMAIQEIRDVIATNVSKQNIENVLGKLCTHLSDKLMSACNEFVKTYSDEVVDMILADFTPQEACTFIKLCTEEKSEYKNVNIVKRKNVEEKGILANPQCQLCKEVVSIVEQRVINRKSKEEIRRELEKSCSRLKKFTKECTKFVDKYSDKIVDLIEKELEPEEVCRELAFCVSLDDIDSQDYDYGLQLLSMAEEQPDEAISEHPQCVICEFVMSKIGSELNNNKTEENIKNSLRHVCGSLPKSVGRSCKQFIDYYFDMAVVLLESMEPSEVCGYMKLCPAPSYDDIIMIEEIETNLYECAICKGLVEGIDTIIEDPYTDVNIENLEEKLCDKFVGKYKPKCHDLAKSYGILIINLLKNLTDSDQICYKLDLCSYSGEHDVSGMLKLT